MRDRAGWLRRCAIILLACGLTTPLWGHSASINGVILDGGNSGATNYPSTMTLSATHPLAVTVDSATVVGAAAAAAEQAGASGHGEPAEDELVLLGLVNAERIRRGLQALRWDPLLARLALDHVRDVASSGKVSHLSPGDGADFTKRLVRAGMIASAAAENVVLDRDVVSTHVSLMASRAHRANILDPDLTAVGIAVTPLALYGLVYVVQDFAAPLSAMSDTEAADQVRRALRQAAARPGDIALPEDPFYSCRVEAELDSLVAADSVKVRSKEILASGWVIAYTCSDPSDLPDDLRRKAGRAVSFGIAVTLRRTPSYPLGVYWVIVALRHL